MISRQLQIAERDRLVAALLQCGGQQQDDFWNAVISDLNEDLKLNFSRNQGLKFDVTDLVKTCQNHRFGIERLLARVSHWEIGGSIALREVMKVTFSITKAMPNSWVDELVEIIVEMGDLAAQEWQPLYKGCCPQSFGAYDPENLFLAKLSLLELDNLTFALNFISRLGHQCSNKRICDWVAQVGQASSVIAKSTNPSQADAATILFHVNPYDHREESFVMDAWLLTNSRQEMLTDPTQKEKNWNEVAAEIQDLTTSVRSLISNLTIDLVLPRKHFCSDVSKWILTTGGTLLRQVPMKLRCHHRFIARRNEIEGQKKGLSLIQRIKMQKDNAQIRLDDWKKKSLELAQHAQSSSTGKLFSIARHDQYQHDDIDKEFRTGKGVFVGVGFVPNESPLSSFCIALDYGAPLAVWFRDISEGKVIEESELREVLKLDECNIKLSELPQHIWKLQTEALEKNDPNDLRYHLMILHDDYEQVPFLQENNP